ASREHLRKIAPVVDEALQRAGLQATGVDALAVTAGPGLIGSLLVGLVYAKALAGALDKPLVGVNHIEGHIHSAWLQNKADRRAGQTNEVARFPNLTLVVSGGHTSLFRVEMKPGGEFTYLPLGQTRDDAAGEAFDKVAKLLALGYPGGPLIDKLARFGNPHAVKLGPIKMRGNPLDFSFSGIKTAILYRVREGPLASEALRRDGWRKERTRVGTPAGVDLLREQCSQATLDLIASFQEAVVTDLITRTLQAASGERVSSIFVAGGVACNSLLRERFRKAGQASGFSTFFPSPSLSTDNAAMIAAAGYFRLKAGERAGNSLTAHATLPLGASDPHRM
ncbi:MAG: tRNA (adenosine(37)-N6)-threonylcarbamoyltransferase complex transferase subunit TsaD, partial [Acidobacteriota bacterium]|nr:tRNA (adenosine(37)-N6)-threonylcarbamoyltransferase complex transferase subunit TsaD [Acidobacteriota bacterium]